jgi:uncharacterized protein YecT (DUF1311 family)
MRIAVMATAMLSSLCSAASFDCQKAATAVEQMVCRNPFLSNLDDEMAKVYSAVLARAKWSSDSGRLTENTTPERLRGEQRSWLAARDKCTEPACVTSAYNSRLSALKAKIHIPQSDIADRMSDGRLIGIDCDKGTKTLEVGYFSSSYPPSKPMDLWDTFQLKTNSIDDRYVLVVHEVVRECLLGDTRYVVTITAEPGNWGRLNGECGDETYGRAMIRRDNETMFNEIFEGCRSEEVVAKVRLTERREDPTVIRMRRKDHCGCE